MGSQMVDKDGNVLLTPFAGLFITLAYSTRKHADNKDAFGVITGISWLNGDCQLLFRPKIPLKCKSQLAWTSVLVCCGNSNNSLTFAYYACVHVSCTV